MSIPNQVMQDLLVAVLNRGSSFRFRARGMSMMPFIMDGDLITIAPVSNIRPTIGQVVAFIQPVSGSLIVHRVVRRQGCDLWIRGDNTGALSFDHIDPGSVLGCVTRVERNGQRVSLGLGIERLLISLLSRWGLAERIAWRLRWLKRLL